jgi:outer membrane protein assembly factor BamB
MLRSGFALASIVVWSAVAFAGSGPEDLWAAARKGDAESVKALLAKGVDVDAKTEYGATALSFAADKGHVGVVKVLLDNKADLNVKDTFYKATPLSWAVSKGHLDIAKLLVDAGAEDADTALLAAAQKGNLDLAQAALKSAKLKPAALDKALAAAPKTNAELIELLTKAGAKAADPSAKVTVKVAPEVLQSYVGAYRSDELVSQVNIALLKDRLQVKAGVFPIFTLSPIDDVKFQAAESDLVTITFVKDKDRVTGFVQKSGTTETAYKRIEARAAPPAATDDSASVTITAPANWPSFRGPNAIGIADGQMPPLTWDAATGRNIRWKTPIPGLGHSCPVIWQNNIYLTTAVSSADKADLKTGLYGNVDSVIDTAPHTFHVLCLDKTTGKINWDKVAHTGVPKVKRHTKATHANSTCATDGKHVVACFGSEGLYCYDAAGQLLWKQELGVLESGWFYDADYQWGYGSSPIIYQNLAIVQCDAGKNSFIAAFRLDSGSRAWTTPRDELPSWGTPTVIESNAGAELVTNATKFVRGYDPLTGKELWRLGRNSEICVPTPFAAHGLIFVASGYRLPRPVYAIRPGARGDITLPKGEQTSAAIAWSNDKGGTYMPTPIVYGEHFYTCSNDGVVTCYHARTGKRVWWERLGSDGGFTASPVAADGRLYCTSEEGLTYVLQAGPEFKLLAENSLGDPCLATPAISDGMMLLRTQRFLFGIGRDARQNKGASSGLD